MQDTECWQAVCKRDATRDGKFWYGVTTTGVYCKPSCGSRRANRENVRFYDTMQAAVSDGLRPCKRCRPEDAESPTLSKLLELCRHVEAHPTATHTLALLSRRANLSQFHLHRLFKSFLQLTPRAYVEQVRVAALKRRLRSKSSITAAIFDAGFESSSVVYGRLDAHLGMTPRSYRSGGRDVDISFAFGDTALGKVMIGATDRGICYLQFGDSERELLEQLSQEYPNAAITPSSAQTSKEFSAWMTALNAQLTGRRSSVKLPLEKLPLDIRGTAFQKRVWEFLRTIPRGQVVSYSEVAEGIGSPTAIRAAASACASNRIAVFIPCHRVLRGTGEMGGYRWGVARKRALIDIERKRSVNRRDSAIDE
ncbi:MAG TPA: bifunctional DNA-binding transcriptional regulator/O6-methylguanine-DNA methyltransferase Ada [Steroidobacteraceae bacterium]|nr:bifunctional DNA-binding transcriptional regulator/O6-methylguanine-DNA methyltransferase Ada [Steroidobacteraceae bacterium]